MTRKGCLGVICVYLWNTDSIAESMRSLKEHLTDTLGLDVVGKWTVQITSKHKHKAKKSTAAVKGMRFGLNESVKLLGSASSRGDSSYPYTRQIFVQCSDLTHYKAVWQQKNSSTQEGDKDQGKSSRFDDVAEGGMDLEEKLSAVAGFPTRLKMLVDGQEFIFGDYTIRLGGCRKGNTHKGVIMEVQYRPTRITSQGLAMVKALLPTLDEQGVFREASDLCDASMFGNGALFTRKHRALQLADVFNKL